MNKPALLLATALLSGCIQFPSSAAPQPPYKIAKFQSDVMPLTPRGSTNLPNLLLTLPVFEVRPDQRQSWIDRNAIGPGSPDRLVVDGDGAQNPLTFERLPVSSGSRLEFKLTIEPWDAPESWVYHLQRVENGWVVLNLNQREQNKP